MSNVTQHLLPLGQVGKMLCEDVRTHVISATVGQLNMTVRDSFMQELNVDSVCPTHVSHGRVLARRHHTDSGGVILHKLGFHASATKSLP